MLLTYGGNRYIRNNKANDKVYWKCARWHSQCKARAITIFSDPYRQCVLKGQHNHTTDSESFSGGGVKRELVFKVEINK